MTMSDPPVGSPLPEEVVDIRTQQALDRIKDALARSKGDEAVRFFNESSTNGLIANDDKVLSWLRRTLGLELTERLISAYANLTCFYCSKGIVTCEECEGRGFDADRTPCPMCLALGINRCDFCGGSGWFTINHVPRAFQFPVITLRVVVAAKEAELVLAGEIPVVAEADPAQAKKLAAKAILQANRLLGVFENMLVAARQEESRNADSAAGVHSAAVTCEKLAPRLLDRICKLLGTLADAERAEASSVTQKTAIQLAQRKSDFYADLASTQNFEGTLLWHPLLIAEHPSPASTPSTSQRSGTDAESQE